MLRIHFTSADLRRVTIAAASDPLWETLLSLHVLQDNGSSIAFRGWRRRVHAARSGSVRLLAELARPWGYSPDFLTPGRGEADFETQLDRVLSTPGQRLRQDLGSLAEESLPSTWTTSLARGETAALRRLGEALTTYHRLALVPYQDAIRTQVEADRARRAQTLLSGGVDQLLAKLHPRVVWQAPVLRIAVYANQDIHLEGRGLVLVPSLFCRIQPITLMDVNRSPVLVYPLSPSLDWLSDPVTGPERVRSSAIVDLLGSTRAAILEAAAGGGTTSDVARRADVSAPVVSRHTAVLRAAGLLETRRHGAAVWHRVTGLGIALLNGDLPH